MHTGTVCPGSNFPGGITNGAHWYTLAGGMQDYNYRASNCLEITLELSCCKYPNTTTLSGYWDANKEALVAYMQQVHMGVKGLVMNKHGQPIANVSVVIEGNIKTVLTTSTGEYWKLLMPGKYNISACNVKVPVEVRAGRVTRIYFKIEKCPYIRSSATAVQGTSACIVLIFAAMFFTMPY